MLKIAHRNIYAHPLPEGHRFPMLKYELLPEQLLYEGTCNQANFFEPENAKEVDIAAVHTKEYIHAPKQLTLDKKAIRNVGFPLSKELVNREEIITNGSIKASDFALEFGIAMNVAGGTHHAYTNRGEAFCLYNDQAIAARYLQRHKNINNILIVDLDVHQGNGTAEIFQHDSSVFTFSMHGASNYPFHKEQSDLDIPLPNGTDDTKYLRTLKNTLPRLINEIQPDFVFYLCGVDILESDKLGKLSCSLKGCAERDRYVLQICKDNSIPVMCSMGGGYSPEIKTIVEAHANTFRIAQEIFF